MKHTGYRCLHWGAAVVVFCVLAACSPKDSQTETEDGAVEGREPAATGPSETKPEQQTGEVVEEAAELDSDDLEFLYGDLDGGKPAPNLLSEYNLFEDPKRQIPNPGVVPYALNTGGFADYAGVDRFVHIPPGKKAVYRADGAFEFPAGTLLIQTMSYPEDKRESGSARRLVETRVMRRLSQTWEGVSYIWNDDGTDAKRAIAGGILDVPALAGFSEEQSTKYFVMNMNDCKRCHENEGEMLAIGPKAMNLNRDYAYASGTKNQLAYWAEHDMLADAPDDLSAVPRLPVWDDPATGTVEERARAWLDVNCAYCHNPRGAGGVSGLDLQLGQTSPVRLGIFKPPVAAGRGSEGLRFSIDPGSPSTSFLIQRLRSTDPSVMMPPVGRRVPHEESIALISEWIASLHFDEDAAEELKARQRELFEYIQREGALPEDFDK